MASISFMIYEDHKDYLRIAEVDTVASSKNDEATSKLETYSQYEIF